LPTVPGPCSSCGVVSASLALTTDHCLPIPSATTPARRPRYGVIALVLSLPIALSFLQLALARLGPYRALYDRHPFYVPETLKSLVQIALTVTAAKALLRTPLRTALGELGFRSPVTTGTAVALMAVLPMLLGFASRCRSRPLQTVSRGLI
jgi:hypothetical protein